VASVPYKTTPDFDQDTLPAALRREHRTKPGTWGLLRVLEGRAILVFIEPQKEVAVFPGAPAIITPQATHFVQLDGPVRLRVEFYRSLPDAE
jgi:tellurite resistance-related uncharacterized protein